MSRISHGNAGTTSRGRGKTMPTLENWGPDQWLYIGKLVAICLLIAACIWLYSKRPKRECPNPSCAETMRLRGKRSSQPYWHCPRCDRYLDA